MEELKAGDYSGNVIKAMRREGMLACVTFYDEDHLNNKIHYHDNIHFSYAIDGGCVEKKKETYEIRPGNIAYYSAGEDTR